VQYEGATEESNSDDILRTDVVGNPTVTRIPAEAIARRMKWNQNLNSSADEEEAVVASSAT
jgi:hypothetical protein